MPTYDYVPDLEKRIAELERQNADYLRSYEKMAKANVRLRELLEDAADAFECAADGSGINFYFYGVEMRKGLAQGMDDG